jgi:two-component system, NtrC family, response regulator AtoC
MSRDPASTTKLSTASTSASGEYELLVAGDGKVSRVPLPKTGELCIGRGGDVGVSLGGEGVSRRHAMLRARGTEFTLEDLGSSNGTVLRGQLLAPGLAVPILPGESALIGDFVLVLRPRRSRAVPRRVLGHEYFELRIGEQCERARESSGQAFYLVGVRVEPKAPVDPAEVVAAELEPADVLGRLSPNEWGLLLVDESENDALACATDLQRALENAGCKGQTAVAAYPRDGTSPGALLAKLSAALGPETEARPAASVLSRSPAMIALYEETDAVARGDISVLILGETGVGKDVLARSLHDRSPRAGKPFLRINCAALPEALLESELFGYERGAFTGAVQSKPGLLQTARGGSVFLDELGELAPRLQAKLLQVLETREITALGSTTVKPLDVRFLSATNRDLEAEALSGQFRSDLYYRIAAYTAVIPPLRERREDILALAQEFARAAAARLGVAPARIRDDAAMRLLDYAWPGNIRELRNVIERAAVLSEGRAIGPEHLPLDKMRGVVLVSRPATAPEISEAVPVSDLSAVELGERNRILEALAQSAGNQSRAAELLGVSRSTLLNRLDAYRIRRPRKRPG